MALTSGTRLGPYEIVSPLGAGGMGEVYKGRDTRLDRIVAIKVLPEHLASDPQFRERFDREARTISQLDHPHICALHDVGHENGIDFLVMQYLEGETLADRIARTGGPKGPPLRIDEALQIAIQIAGALDKAHRKGIVHRDLKPGNIMLVHRGGPERGPHRARLRGGVQDPPDAKLLDFGLAKVGSATTGPNVQGAVGAGFSRPGASALPTTPPGLTAQGTILGTFQYMSPEQLEGQEADARTDIFAFGAVLYEMITGKKAFEGKSQASLIAAILDRDPSPISTLQPLAPPALDRIIATCLAKDPDARWQNAGDLARELTWIQQGGAVRTTDVVTASAPVVRRTRLMWSVVGLIAGLLIGTVATTLLVPSLTSNSGEESRDVARVLVSVSPADQLRAATDVIGDLGQLSRTAIALSPDGRTLVFSAVRDDRQQLYARALNQLDAVPLPGTEGAANPFFSPDGLWVGFWANGAIKKAPLSGGAPTTLCESPAIFGGSWGSNDTIVFARERGGLWQVAATGGSPTALTTVNAEAGEVSHRLPQLLPGNEHVIFTVTRGLLPTWDDTQVVVQSLATGERKILIEGGADARHTSTGHLVYVRRGALMAAPFDLRGLAVNGGAVALIADLMQAANMPSSQRDSGAGQFAIAESGSLAYVPGGIYSFPDRALVWVDRSGRTDPLPAPPRVYITPRLSPDGTQVLFSTQGDRNVWVYDLRRGTTTRLTVDGRSLAAIWTPDGKRVTFGSSTAGSENLFWKPADGSGLAERLTTSGNQHRVSAWSPDGQTLLFVESTEPDQDILGLSTAANSQPTPVVRTRFNEAYPEFSPDGRWLAYASDESGRSEVYVQPYPDPGPRAVISTAGGSAPSWRRDSRELFYIASIAAAGATGAAGTVTMMAVPVTPGATFTAGTPQMLFQGRFGVAASLRGYDVTPDGQRFLMVQTMERPPITPTQVVLVQNWHEELRRRVPVN